MANLRCQRCGNTTRFKWKGYDGKTRRFQCKVCGTRGRYHGEPETSFTQEGNERVLTLETTRDIQTEQDVLDEIKVKVDLDEWAIDHFRVGVSHAWRKDRQVEWQVENGQVIHGDVHDTGKILDHPQRTLQVWLKRRTKEIRARLVTSDLKRDMLEYAPRYNKITYPRFSDSVLLDLGIFDLHFGRMAWGQESGADYDVKLAEKVLRDALTELMSYSKGFNISKILIPVCGDFFNSNSKKNTTVKGTEQQEDTRYAKTFKLGRQLAVSVIDDCSQIAPVQVVLVKGNHDEERLFYLGDALECWYHQNRNVTIDNSPKGRKYVLHGKTLLGYTHGGECKLEELPMNMALEAPDFWSQSTYREFHTGDKHHRFLTVEKGVVIRIRAALTAPDEWTYRKGYNSLRASESFLYHSEDGLIGQFTASVK